MMKKTALGSSIRFATDRLTLASIEGVSYCGNYLLTQSNSDVVMVSERPAIAVPG